MNTSFKIGLPISGKLGYQMLMEIASKYETVCVLTDSNSMDIISYCRDKNIPVFTGNPRKNKEKLLHFLNKHPRPDLFFSINYLFILEREIFEFPRKGSLNIHGSLLPKYRGRTPHVWAVINGEKETGITVHKIDEGVDTGDILLQKKIPVGDEDTGNDILMKFMNEYPSLIMESIELIGQNKAVFRKQDDDKATYFGKRTPDDGLINWDWSKERIRNWVRAQARPYPGAFTFVDGTKIIIHKIEFSGKGFHYEMPNGLILDEKEFIIKTVNGAVKIVDFEINNMDLIKNGKVLGI
jgi:methionyl-tRNA formyltransferase